MGELALWNYSVSHSLTTKNFLCHDSEDPSWLDPGALGAVLGTQHPQSLTPLASRPLQSGWTSPSHAFPRPSGVQSKTPYLLSGQPEGLSQVHMGSRLRTWAHLSWEGCSGLEALPSFCWGLSPTVGTSNLGPQGFPKNEVRCHLPWKSW